MLISKRIHFSLFAMLLFVVACNVPRVEREIYKMKTLEKDIKSDQVDKRATSAPLEVQMKNGMIYHFDKWVTVQNGRIIEGTGYYTDTLRERKYLGKYKIRYDSIANIGTNRIEIPASEIGTTLNLSDSYLKVHMKNGSMYYFEKWTLNFVEKKLSGFGTYYDQYRNNTQSGKYRIGFDSIALIETNYVGISASDVGFGILFVMNSALTILCISNPKACYGSCPTYYVSDGNKSIIQAEGFSASVAPALEERDVDALYKLKPEGRILEVQLTNEAMETHYIRESNILSLRKPSGGRVFQTQSGEFTGAVNFVRPLSIDGGDKKKLDLLSSFDYNEYYSETDSSDLNRREELEIDFGKMDINRKGLALSFRQSLATTYLFYNGLSLLGSKAGEMLVKLGTGDSTVRKLFDATQKRLGGIKLLCETTTGEWIEEGEFYEYGPIATETKALILNSSDKQLTGKLKLVMAKGVWRIDYATLFEPVKVENTHRIKPFAMLENSEERPDLLNKLNDPDQYLVNLPGDSYKLLYNLPEDYSDYEYFMESKGYYLEWMRKEWMKDENLPAAYMYMQNPDRYLKDMAPKFKKIEKESETSFWGSKYVR